MERKRPTRRFTRGCLLPMTVTARDRAILAAVAQHRFLDSRQISRLLGGSTQQILRRLQRLFHAGYLNRPLAQLRYFSETGSRPLVYEINGRGKRLLPDPTKLRRHPVKATGQIYLDHTLLVASVTLGFMHSRHFDGTPFLRLEAELGRPGWPATWTAPVRHDGAVHRIGIGPDKMLAVEASGKPPLLLFIEADCGTMPIVRRSLKQSSFLRKLLAYEATWSKRLTKESHGIERFRVLTVTTSPARAKNLAAACARLTSGRGLFLFTDIESLKKSPNIYAHTWQSGRGGEDRIFGT